MIRTVEGRVDPAEILDTGRFDPARAGEAAGWQRTLADADPDDGHATHDGDGQAHDHDHAHAHPDETYGVTSFTYRRRRPFHPARFLALLEELPSSVVRSKGLFWAVGREETALLSSQAGANVCVEAFGPWLANLPAVERDLYRSNRPEVEWDDDHGDRRTEIVFIGTGECLEESLVARFDDCLVTDEEWGTVDDDSAGEFPAAERFPAVDDDPLKFAAP